MAREVRDCAIMLEVMSGHDSKDSTSLDLPVPNWEAALNSDLRGKTVGIPKEYRIDGVPAEIDAVWEQGIAWLKDAGAESSKCRCRTPNMRCRLITSSPGRGLLEPRPLRRRAVRPAGAGQGGLTEMYEATASPASARR
jgi:Asp-tRNA(Asn)/Glu-tRNA(Gln) amidotransferase A subunit family amidase